MGLTRFITRKQILQVVRDEVFQPDKTIGPFLISTQTLHRDQARQGIGDLNTGKTFGAGIRLPNQNRQVETQAGDMGKWSSRIKRERRQNREYLIFEVLVRSLLLRLGQLFVMMQMNPGLGQLCPQILETALHLFETGAYVFANSDKLLDRCQAIGRNIHNPRRNLLSQSGYPHHKKLIHI